MPYKANEARRHRIPRARHRVANWPDHDRALQRRGSPTVWVTPEAPAAWLHPGPAGGVGRATALVHNQGLRDRRRPRPGSRLRPGAGAGARVAAGVRPARPPAGRARLGGRRPRLGLRRLPSAHLGHGRAARDPAQAHRRAGDLPGLDLRQPAPRREPVGSPEGVARGRHPLREDRTLLHRRALPRSNGGSAQDTEGPEWRAGSGRAQPHRPHSPAPASVH